MVDGLLTVVEDHRIAKEVESCLKEEIEDLTQVIIHVDPYLKDEKRTDSQEMNRKTTALPSIRNKRNAHNKFPKDKENSSYVGTPGLDDYPLKK